MRRFLSVWLPRWAIERRYGVLALRQGNALPPDGQRPLALSTMRQAGAALTATNAAAEKQGLYAGMAVADARAIYPNLIVEAADEDGDQTALTQLALWCQRYTPLTRTDLPDGLMLDITGCAHLFGGEEKMAADLIKRFNGFGLTVRLAIAPAIGAAWAMARFADKPVSLISRADMAADLAPLPVSGLRIAESTLAALARVGLKRIGLLIGKPRAPLVARFGADLVLRLDQALGVEDEHFDPLFAPPFYRAECRFPDPVLSLDAVEMSLGHLTCKMEAALYDAGKAARRLDFTLFRVDGWHQSITVRMTRLSREAGHMAHLIKERLGQYVEQAGFGFEVAVLSAYDVEDCDGEQEALDRQVAAAGDLAQLLDRLSNRFGPHNVVCFVPSDSYVPERASRAVPVLDAEGRHDWAAHEQSLTGHAGPPRPVMLLQTPEPVTVLVEVPDKPPVRFEWRRIPHRVTRAEGPERIAPEWWRADAAEDRTRDYYRVEDEYGRRFWLYREGLYERSGEGPPRWYLQGLAS